MKPFFGKENGLSESHCHIHSLRIKRIISFYHKGDTKQWPLAIRKQGNSLASLFSGQGFKHF